MFDVDIDRATEKGSCNTFTLRQQDKNLTNVLFGANGIELCRIVEEQLGAVKTSLETGAPVTLPKYDLEEMMPVEIEKKEADLKQEQEYFEEAERLRVLTLAARKKRVTERLAAKVKRLNFILFWPHNHKAHYDLYANWDALNINVSAKDEFNLTEDDCREVMYMSDVDLNEACLYALMDGPALCVLFKMFDTDDRDFVKLMRHALYEEIPEPKEDLPPEKQLPPIPAFERYATISKTAREVRRQRHNAKLQKIKEEQEEAARLKKEQERMAKQAEEDRIREEKQKKDEERMARLAAGVKEGFVVTPEAAEGEGEKPPAEGAEGGATPAEGGAPPTEGGVPPAEGGEPLAEGEVPPEEAPVEKVFNSDEEQEDEDYIPPGGLFVPGLYSPPNELAKANGLKFFFPKICAQYYGQRLETEHLPPHVLVMFTVDKRNEVNEIINQYQDEILATGFFVGDDPFHCEHVAYTIRQYNKMERLRKHLDRMALMVSRKRSLPLLQLAGLNPLYISSDLESGERECLTLFPVGYGDDYEEVESIKEEEVKPKDAKHGAKEEVKEEV
ncbi:hypothetical protein NE865_12334 [Phthorimaea operculella]|nr:hypothetical protein NE865_12334 [Phthorimaea operculella]